MSGPRAISWHDIASTSTVAGNRRCDLGETSQVVISKLPSLRGLYGKGQWKSLDILSAFGYYVAMTTAERINKTLQQLAAPFQQEVLDFVEFLLKKQAMDDKAWKEFSLTQAMQGLEDDDMPEYGEADLKERWA